jgi:hypothetical protein
MTGSLTQDIMNYIKIKVSKRDAMKISCAVAAPAQQARGRDVGLPPLSPPRKLKKVKTGKT